MPVIPRLFGRLNTGGGVLGFPNPLTFPFMELYLNSAVGFGLSGADGSRPDPWPDRSGNARNAASAGNFVPQYRTIIANGASPNGTPSMQFDGFDNPFSQYNLNINPNPWPTLARGYTFYFLFNLRGVPNSSSGGDLLWCEQGTSRFRVSPRNPGGIKPVTYRDEITDHPSGQAFTTGWQTIRCVLSPSVPQGPALGTVTMYRNGTPLTFADNTYQLTPGICQGYIIGQLGTSQIVGLNAFCGVFCWFSQAHSVATQTLLENYWRLQFGLPLL